MRKILAFLALVGPLAVSSAWAAVDQYRPLDVRGTPYRVHGRYAQARRLILDRNLLTPEQLRCVEIVPGDKAAGQVTQVRVLRRPLAGCPADQGGSPFLFDLYIDNASGSYQWTPASVDQLEELPYLGDARRSRLQGQ